MLTRKVTLGLPSFNVANGCVSESTVPIGATAVTVAWGAPIAMISAFSTGVKAGGAGCAGAGASVVSPDSAGATGTAAWGGRIALRE